MSVVTEKAYVHDEREVSVNVRNAPPLRTPAGKNPIVPYHVRLTYNIATSKVTSIVVLGRGAINPRNYRHRDGFVRRRVDEHAAPAWLTAIVEKHRP